MEKINLLKMYKSYYHAAAKPELVELGPAGYVSITGTGDPSAPAFTDAVQALYSVAYTLKFEAKMEGQDFAVPKLEGQWWFDTAAYPGVGMTEAPLKIPRSTWEYRLLIRIPDSLPGAGMDDVSGGVSSWVERAARKTAEKKKLPRAAQVTWFSLPARSFIQMLHVGPFSTEPETLERMKIYMDGHGYVQDGLHQEIYLSDFRKTAPEKLRTILREPVLPG